MFIRNRGRSSAIIRVALLAGAAVIGISGSASAGSLIHDYVYSDSFGNLIVQSPYGYKRIIVGEGRLARKMSSLSGAGEPKVAYADREDGYARYGYYYDDCYRPAVLLKGRGYMYGLPDGVLPEPSGHCPTH
jgi:hypothetical protein